MTLAFWCVLIAALLPYVWGSLSKSGGSYDNARPRLQQKTGRRCVPLAWSAGFCCVLGLFVAAQAG